MIASLKEKWRKVYSLFNHGETSGHLIKTFILYGLIALSIIVTKVLIARLYGQMELGIFSYFFSLVTVAFLFTSLGFPEAITQIIVKNQAKMKDALKKALIFISVITVVVLFVLLEMKSVFATEGLEDNFVWYIVVYTFFYLTYSLLRGFKKFTECSVYSLVNRVVFIGCVILFAILSINFNLLLMSMSFALLVAGVIAIPTIRRVWKSTAQTEKVETRELFNLAISLFLMQTGFYLLRETDTLLIPYLAGFQQQAIYSAQSSISNIIRLVAYVFPVVVLPMAVVSKYKLRQSLLRILKLLLPFSALILVLTYITIPILYGPQYADRWLPVVLVVSSTLLVIYSYFNSILVGENKFSSFYFKIILVDFLITLLVNTGLTIFLVLRWGIVGAPIATGITVLLKIGLNGWGIKRLRGKSEEEEQEVGRQVKENEPQVDNHKNSA